MQVLVINSGSSSLKYQVRDIEANEVLLEGLIEKIGEPEVPDPDIPLDHLIRSERLGGQLDGPYVDHGAHSPM